MVDYADLPDKTLLRPDEVAEFFSVSVKTIYQWCESDVLDSASVNGKALRIYRASVIGLVEAGRSAKIERDESSRPRRVISKGIK